MMWTWQWFEFIKYSECSIVYITSVVLVWEGVLCGGGVWDDGGVDAAVVVEGEPDIAVELEDEITGFVAWAVIEVVEVLGEVGVEDAVVVVGVVGVTVDVEDEEEDTNVPLMLNISRSSISGTGVRQYVNEEKWSQFGNNSANVIQWLVVVNAIILGNT